MKSQGSGFDFAKAIPEPGEGKRGPEGYLGYLLRQANAAARLSLERSLADIGLTVPQFLVLTMVNAYPGASGAELARVALLTPQTVGVIIRNLEEAGAITKSPHPVHGRALQWTLTEEGSKQLSQCRMHTAALEARLASLIPKGAEPEIRAWLATVATELRH